MLGWPPFIERNGIDAITNLAAHHMFVQVYIILTQFVLIGYQHRGLLPRSYLLFHHTYQHVTGMLPFIMNIDHSHGFALYLNISLLICKPTAA